MSNSENNSISFGMGLLFGVLAGVAAGVLYSPKPGEEMRKDLKEATDKFVTENDPEIKYVRAKYDQIFARLSYALEKQVEKANVAIKACRMAAAKRKEEIASDYNIEES